MPTTKPRLKIILEPAWVKVIWDEFPGDNMGVGAGIEDPGGHAAGAAQPARHDIRKESTESRFQ